MKCPDCKNTNGLYIPLIGAAEPCRTCNGSQEISDKPSNDDTLTDMSLDEVKEEPSSYIEIDGDRLEIFAVRKHGEGYDIETEDGDYYIYHHYDDACRETRAYWEDMANHSPDEFVELVGKENLISWALGQCALGVHSLGEWLNVVAGIPEGHLGGYDGAEYDIGEYVCDDLEGTFNVGFRYN